MGKIKDKMLEEYNNSEFVVDSLCFVNDNFYYTEYPGMAKGKLLHCKIVSVQNDTVGVMLLSDHDTEIVYVNKKDVKRDTRFVGGKRN